MSSGERLRPPAGSRMTKYAPAAAIDGERDVDEERPAPVQVLGQDAAEDQADGAAATGDRAVDAERLGALLGVGEHHGEQGERGGREQRAEDALQGTGAEHHRLAGGGAAERGGRGEADQTDDEGALAAPQVGDPAAEEQQTAEGEGVGGDDPLPVAVRDAQVLLGGGQGDVHDGRVEDDHQLGEGDECERFPAVGVGNAGCLAGCFGHRGAPSKLATEFRNAEKRTGLRKVRLGGWRSDGLQSVG